MFEKVINHLNIPKHLKLTPNGVLLRGPSDTLSLGNKIIFVYLELT